MLRRGWRTAGVCAVLCLSAGAGFGIINGGSAGAVTVFTVNDTSDLGLATPGGTTCASTAGPTDCTLRAAIEASSNLGTGTAVNIVLASATYTIANAYNSSDPADTGAFKIAGDVTITGNGAANTIVGGADLDRVFIVDGGATADISDLSIENGQTVLGNSSENGSCFASGGAICNVGTLTLTDDIVADSTAEDGYGGGVADTNEATGPTTLTGTTVELDLATDSGGGVIDQSPDGMTINGGSDITSDTADENGGGIVAFAQSGVTLTITDSDVNGNFLADGSGGGIAVEDGENLDITGSQIESNNVNPSDFGGYGGGLWILIGGTDTFTDDTILENNADNGGGVADESGTQTFTDSIIENNGAVVGGGGILVDSATGVLTINQSLIDTNDATGDESNGEVASGAGGGIYIHACATVHLTNDTLYDNVASSEGGGAFSDNCASSGGNASLVSDTIDANTANGSGANLNVGSDVAVTLTNSVVAGGGGANCALNDFTSGGYNLEDDSTCDPNGTTDTVVAPNHVGLGGLDENGGPTETLLPNAGSPAIAAIPSASCTVTVDQRGYNRHAGASGSCTIGSVEYGASSGSTITPTTIYVNAATGSDSNDCLTPTAGAQPYNGPCQTIAHAVALLNNSDATYGTNPTETVDYTSVATISAAGGTYDESPITIDLPDRTLTIVGPAFTAGDDPTAIVVPTDTADPLFTVGPSADGTTVTLQNLWLQEASSPSEFPAAGGGVDNPNGSLTLDTDEISGFTTTDGGGGISNGGTLTVDGSSISGNTTSGGSGGGISNAGTLTVGSSIFTNNNTDNDGGAIQNGGALTLDNSTLIGNRAGGRGGALDQEGGISMTLSDDSISDSNAGGDGGGLYADSGTVGITGGTIGGTGATSPADEGNITDSCGGGLALEGATATLSGVTIGGSDATQGNTADEGCGGGVYVSAGVSRILGRHHQRQHRARRRGCLR